MTFAFNIILERCSKLHSQLLLLNWKLCNGNLILKEALLTNWKPCAKKEFEHDNFLAKCELLEKANTHPQKNWICWNDTSLYFVFKSCPWRVGIINPYLNPSPYPFDFWANDFPQHFVVIYQYHLAHFEVEDSRQLGLARLHLINMHTTFGVQFSIYVVHQNVCLRVMCTHIDGRS